MLLICASVVLPSLLSAQDFRPGYIVKNNTDTIKGFVAYRGDAKNREGCTFKNSRKSASSNYTVADIDGFGIIGDRLYQAMQLPADAPVQEKVFVKVLVQGNINLYMFKDFFLVKRKDALTLLPIPKNKVLGEPDDLKLQEDKKYIGVLNHMMFDCRMNLDKTGYTEASLSQAVYKYNLCKNEEHTFRNPRPLGKVDFTMYAGYQNSSLTYDAQRVIPFKGNTIVAGGGIDLYSPRIFDRLFFTIDLWYTKNFYQGYYEGVFTGDPIKEDVYAEFTSIKLPFGVKYNFRGPASTPYIRAGVFWTSVKYSKIRTISTRELPDAVYIDEISEGYQLKNPKGYWLSVGYERRIYKNNQVFTEFRYERAEGYMGTTSVNESLIVNYNFLIGFRF